MVLLDGNGVKDRRSNEGLPGLTPTRSAKRHNCGAELGTKEPCMRIQASVPRCGWEASKSMTQAVLGDRREKP